MEVPFAAMRESGPGPGPAVHLSPALRQLPERNPTLGGGGQYRRS